MNDLLKMHFKLFIREKSFFCLYITNFAKFMKNVATRSLNLT